MIPCYNEGRGLGPLLDELGGLADTCDVLVVDDGSTDDTHAVASQRARCVRLPQNLGIGGAVQTAIRFADAHGYGFCLQLDGDGQHPPDQIEVMLRAYRESPANLLVGSRFLGSGGFRSTGARRLGIGILRGTIAALYGQTISDPTSGFRLMDRAAIRLFAAEYPVDYPEPISVAVALSRSLSVRETAVVMRPRVTGTSSIRGLRTAIYLLRVIGYLFLIRVGRYL
jgi:glycosyltransferase involved in cell wall biosynthesis